MKVTNPKNGEVFPSRFKSHAEAHTALLRRLDENESPNPEFATSIAFATRPIRGEVDASNARLFWLHKLAHEGARKQRAAESVDLSELKELLDTAHHNGKKFPKLHFTTDKGLEFVVSRAGDKSKNPGCLYIKSGAYMGKITPEGHLYPTRDFKPECLPILKSMAADPIGYAAKHGIKARRCCFCGHALSDEDKSMELGYGPTCAKRHGLAHTKGAAKAKAASGLRGAARKPARRVKRVIRRKIEDA